MPDFKKINMKLKDYGGRSNQYNADGSLMTDEEKRKKAEQYNSEPSFKSNGTDVRTPEQKAKAEEYDRINNPSLEQDNRYSKLKKTLKRG